MPVEKGQAADVRDELERLRAENDALKKILVEREKVAGSKGQGTHDADRLFEELREVRRQYLNDIESEIRLIGEYLLLENQHNCAKKLLADRMADDGGEWKNRYEALAGSLLGGMQLRYWKAASKARKLFRRILNGCRGALGVSGQKEKRA